MQPTLTQFLLTHLHDHPEQYAIAQMMDDLATIGTLISKETNRAGIAGILGATGDTNVQDEEVQKLDIFTNNLCKSHLSSTGNFAAMSSEEDETVVAMGDKGKDAQYVIAFDPLDGSSNIDVNGSVGTIFSVHKRLPDVERAAEEQFFQKGSTQVLAGYFLYSASTVLVFSVGDGVYEFTLDPTLGSFLLSDEKMTIPASGGYYAVNEAKIHLAPEKDQNFIKQVKESGMNTRWFGSLVGDFHRTLKKGGVFVYPLLDSKGTGEFKPKLRLNFELKTMAYLLEQAGGRAVSGDEDMLDVVPVALHERRAVVMGSTKFVEQYLST